MLPRRYDRQRKLGGTIRRTAKMTVIGKTSLVEEKIPPEKYVLDVRQDKHFENERKNERNAQCVAYFYNKWNTRR